MKRLLIIITLVLASASVFALDYTPRQLIVKAAARLEISGDRTGIPAFDAFLDSYNASNLKPITGMHTNQYYTVDLGMEPDWQTIRSGAYRFDGIEYIEPNFIRKMYIEPNDPLYSRQLHGMVSLPAAWDLTTGSSVVVVGIVDSGVLSDHPDLAENIFINATEIPDNGIDDDGNGYIDDWRGWDFADAPELADTAIGDFLEPDNDPTDENFHGTHVAGIVGALGNNGVGVSGVAWNVKLLPVRAGFRTTGGDGYLQDDDAAAAVIYAADMGCSVINMSWGDPNYSAIIADACEYAYSRGVTLVASSGNNPIPVLSYPARLSTVISVGSVNRARVLSGFSSYGVDLDLVAPGEMVLSTYKMDQGEQYIEQSGTSMSSPYVAGAAALLKSLQPNLTPDQIRSRLLSTADDLGNPGFDTRYGHGLLNVRRMLETTNPPHITISYPYDMQGISEGFDLRGTVEGEGFLRYSVMRSSKLSPAASDWRNIHNDTAEPYYYYQQVSNGTIARFNIPDHLPEGRYMIRVQYSDVLGNIYNQYLSVYYDLSQPVFNQASLLAFSRYDGQRLRYYASGVFDEEVRSHLEIIASDGSLHYAYATTQDSLQIWAFPSSIPQGSVDITIKATNFSGLEWSSSVYEDFVDIDYRVIPTYGYEYTNVGAPRVPFKGTFDFDGNGMPEYVAMDLPTSGFGRAKIYEPSPGGHLLMHDFEDEFRPMGLGNTNASGMEVLGLRADRAYLWETQENHLYPNIIAWADSSVSGGVIARYYGTNQGILMVKNLPTENVIQAYRRDSGGQMTARNKLRNTSSTSLRNTFVPTIIVEDFDGDATPDILCADTDGDVMIYEIQNDNAEQLSWTRRMPVANTYHLTSGDYTGDGYKEFVIGGYYTSITNPDMNFWYLEGFKRLGNNSYASIGSMMFNTVESQNAIHSADLDSDGTDELILALSPNLYVVKYEDGEWNPVFHGQSYQTYSIGSYSDASANIKFLTNYRTDADSVFAAEWHAIEPFTGPTSPSLNLVEPLDEQSISVQWSHPGADSYRVYRKDQSGQSTLVLETEQSSFVDTGLTEGMSYEYAVSAVDASYSPSESIASLWQSAIPFRKPVLQSITMVGTNELRLLFNQAMAGDAINPNYYRVSGGMGSPSSVNLIHNHWGIQLRFAKNFDNENSPYSIEYHNLRGQTGVSPELTEHTFNFMPDLESPKLLSAVASHDHLSIGLEFSESLSPAGLSLITNYHLTLPASDQDNRVTSAYLENGKVILSLASPLKYSNQSYYVEVSGLTDIAGNTVSDQYNVARVQLREISDLSKIKVFPNPIRTDEHNWITFINFPTGKTGKLAIFDSAGIPVFRTDIGPFSLDSNNITWRWNLINQNGLKVSSGIYYYVIEMDGMTKRGQIALIK